MDIWIKLSLWFKGEKNKVKKKLEKKIIFVCVFLFVLTLT